MYDEIGDTEIAIFEKKLSVLAAMKKISTTFGFCNDLSLDFAVDCESDELYSMTAISQYEVFNNLIYNGISLELFAGDIDLVRDDLLKQNMATEEDCELMLIESIIFQLSYKDDDAKKYKDKIIKLLKVLTVSDPYKSDDISYKPYTVKRFEFSKWVHEICFPCSIDINEEITNAVINLFI